MEKRRASFVLLENKDGDYLLYLRDNKPSISSPGTWALIGGAAEGNENPEETVIRETKEEIDLDVRKVRFIGSYVNRDCKVSIFKDNIDKKIKDIDLTEGQRVEYFNFDKVLKLKMGDQLKKFLTDNKDNIVS